MSFFKFLNFHSAAICPNGSDSAFAQKSCTDSSQMLNLTTKCSFLNAKRYHIIRATPIRTD